MDLLLTNIGVLATPEGTTPRTGDKQGDIRIVKDAMVGIKDGKLVYVGPRDNGLSAKETLDCQGKLVTPGLVDSHTHLVFGGWRDQEFGMKLDGVPYLDILRQGGGILSTVKQTREATEEELYEKAWKALDEMLAHGTTTVEAKSGYGLDLETELKQLRVNKRLADNHVVDIASTFMGAHAIPKEYENHREEFIRLLVEEMLPAVWETGLAEFCDIFCEDAVFTPEESRYILTEARKLGYKLKAHADEIEPIGGAEMAAEVGCLTAEHLIMASDHGIQAMAKAGTIAVLLPATTFYIDKPYARAREMIQAGVPVAVASDFNPGSSPNLNMQVGMNISCLKYKMTPAEVLTASTLNAAAAVNRGDSVGTLELGKKADVLVWDAHDLAYLFYRFGSNLVETVIKNGIIQHNK